MVIVLIGMKQERDVLQFLLDLTIVTAHFRIKPQSHSQLVQIIRQRKFGGIELAMQNHMMLRYGEVKYGKVILMKLFGMLPTLGAK